jgi:hypothetical protein
MSTNSSACFGIVDGWNPPHAIGTSGARAGFRAGRLHRHVEHGRHERDAHEVRVGHEPSKLIDHRVAHLHHEALVHVQVRVGVCGEEDLSDLVTLALQGAP